MIQRLCLTFLVSVCVGCDGVASDGTSGDDVVQQVPSDTEAGEVQPADPQDASVAPDIEQPEVVPSAPGPDDAAASPSVDIEEPDGSEGPEERQPEGSPEAETLSSQLCATAELEHATSAFNTPESGTLFALSTSSIKANTGAMGDIDNDGRVDLVVGMEVFFNCGDAGFARLSLPAAGLPMPSSTLMLDLTGDDAVDLVMGDISGSIHVFVQQDDGYFAAPLSQTLVAGAFFPALTPLPDGDGDGVVDYLYASAMTWPFNIITNGTPNAVEEFERKRQPNVLLRVRPGGVLEEVEQDLDVFDCGNSPTFAAHFVPRHHRGQADAFWIANTWAADCAYATDGYGRPVGPMLMPTDVIKPYTLLNFAMGADHFLTDDGPVVATSDIAALQIGQPGVQMWRIRDDNMVERYEGGDPQNVPMIGQWGRTNWGIHFADFDRDGQRDLLCADAAGGELMGFDELGQPDVARSVITRQGGLSFYKGNKGAFDQSDELVPVAMADRGWYGTLVGDFLGAEGRGDGCPDVLITSFAIPSQDPEISDIYFDSPVMVMRNRCETDSRFIGLRGGSAHVGAVAEFVLEGGVTKRASFRGSSGIGGMSSISVNVALMAGEQITAVTVKLASGLVVSVEPPESGFEGWITL